MSTWVNQLWASEFPLTGLLVKHLPNYPTTVDGRSIDGRRRSARGCCVSFVDPTSPGLDSYETHEFPFYPPNQSLFITSCEGLILFENLRGTITTVCNPATKMLKFLPRPVSDPESNLRTRVMHIATGFGKDLRRNRFKAVRIFGYCYYDGRDIDENYVEGKVVAQVYTLRNNVDDEKWRNIRCPDCVGADIKRARSTYVAGSYYWLTGVGTNDLLEFNFATENFSISTSLPIDRSLAPRHLYQFFSCNGRLTVAGYNRQGESGPGGHLFVFWYLDDSSSSWNLISRLALDGGVVRPIYVQSSLVFCEKKSGTDNYSVITVHPLFPLEGIDEPFVLGVYDYIGSTRVVTYEGCPNNYILSNAQQMNGHYHFQEDGGDDDVNY